MTDLTKSDRDWFMDQIRQLLHAEFERSEFYRRAAQLNEDRMLSIVEVCQILGVSQTKLAGMRETGDVRFANVGGAPKTTWAKLQEDIERMYA
ncbi:MAG: hypothetical protein CMM84_05260 [Rhodothermaceae bacterium]|nr:hypothetical protein [Rhodothermaceae bacterium]MBC14961.1 hypothetical protein [Rhodothermaceae bacterium]